MHAHKADSPLLSEEDGCSLRRQAEAQGGEKRFWQGMKHPRPERLQFSRLQLSRSARSALTAATADATFAQAGKTSQACDLALGEWVHKGRSFHN